MRLTTFTHPCGRARRVCLSDRKHPLIQVSGVWVKRSSLSVYVRWLHKCCHRTRRHVDSSAGLYPSDPFTHEGKYDLQLTSREARVYRESSKGCGF